MAKGMIMVLLTISLFAMISCYMIEDDESSNEVLLRYLVQDYLVKHPGIINEQLLDNIGSNVEKSRFVRSRKLATDYLRPRYGKRNIPYELSNESTGKFGKFGKVNTASSGQI